MNFFSRPFYLALQTHVKNLALTVDYTNKLIKNDIN